MRIRRGDHPAQLKPAAGEQFAVLGSGAFPAADGQHDLEVWPQAEVRRDCAAGQRIRPAVRLATR
ncbi:hypothetical protein ACQPXH_08500 [Nocardia sp. CA-135953]|uniref:hypothetical protein n=1 Tax=Nocardia sp. CA-135953 TaxID=3239978 RepID=UPI003D967CB0